jgi:hypothetical protein
MPQSNIVCFINSTQKYFIYKFALSLLIYKGLDPWHTLWSQMTRYIKMFTVLRLFFQVHCNSLLPSLTVDYKFLDFVNSQFEPPD